MTDPLLSLLTPPPWIGMIHARLGAVLPSRVHLLLKIHAPLDGEPAAAKPPTKRGRGRPAVPVGQKACKVCTSTKAHYEFPTGRRTCKACTNEAWRALWVRK